MKAQLVYSPKYGMFEGRVGGRVVSRAKKPKAVVRCLMTRYDATYIECAPGVQADVLAAKRTIVAYKSVAQA
jgi:hypothetical protein